LITAFGMPRGCARRPLGGRMNRAAGNAGAARCAARQQAVCLGLTDIQCPDCLSATRRRISQAAVCYNACISLRLRPVDFRSQSVSLRWLPDWGSLAEGGCGRGPGGASVGCVVVRNWPCCPPAKSAAWSASAGHRARKTLMLVAGALALAGSLRGSFARKPERGSGGVGGPPADHFLRLRALS